MPSLLGHSNHSINNNSTNNPLGIGTSNLILTADGELHDPSYIAHLRKRHDLIARSNSPFGSRGGASSLESGMRYSRSHSHGGTSGGLAGLMTGAANSHSSLSRPAPRRASYLDPSGSSASSIRSRRQSYGIGSGAKMAYGSEMEDDSDQEGDMGGSSVHPAEQIPSLTDDDRATRPGSLAPRTRSQSLAYGATVSSPLALSFSAPRSSAANSTQSIPSHPSVLALQDQGPPPSAFDAAQLSSESDSEDEEYAAALAAAGVDEYDDVGVTTPIFMRQREREHREKGARRSSTRRSSKTAALLGSPPLVQQAGSLGGSSTALAEASTELSTDDSEEQDASAETSDQRELASILLGLGIESVVPGQGKCDTRARGAGKSAKDAKAHHHAHLPSRKKHRNNPLLLSGSTQHGVTAPAHAAATIGSAIKQGLPRVFQPSSKKLERSASHFDSSTSGRGDLVEGADSNAGDGRVRFSRTFVSNSAGGSRTNSPGPGAGLNSRSTSRAPSPLPHSPPTTASLLLPASTLTGYKSSSSSALPSPTSQSPPRLTMEKSSGENETAPPSSGVARETSSGKRSSASARGSGGAKQRTSTSLSAKFAANLGLHPIASAAACHSALAAGAGLPLPHHIAVLSDTRAARASSEDAAAQQRRRSFAVAMDDWSSSFKGIVDRQREDAIEVEKSLRLAEKESEKMASDRRVAEEARRRASEADADTQRTADMLESPATAKVPRSLTRDAASTDAASQLRRSSDGAPHGGRIQGYSQSRMPTFFSFRRSHTEGMTSPDRLPTGGPADLMTDAASSPSSSSSASMSPALPLEKPTRRHSSHHTFSIRSRRAASAPPEPYFEPAVFAPPASNANLNVPNGPYRTLRHLSIGPSNEAADEGREILNSGSSSITARDSPPSSATTTTTSPFGYFRPRGNSAASIATSRSSISSGGRRKSSVSNSVRNVAGRMASGFSGRDSFSGGASGGTCSTPPASTSSSGRTSPIAEHISDEEGYGEDGGRPFVKGLSSPPALLGDDSVREDTEAEMEAEALGALSLPAHADEECATLPQLTQQPQPVMSIYAPPLRLHRLRGTVFHATRLAPIPPTPAAVGAVADSLSIAGGQTPLETCLSKGSEEEAEDGQIVDIKEDLAAITPSDEGQKSPEEEPTAGRGAPLTWQGKQLSKKQTKDPLAKKVNSFSSRLKSKLNL